MPAFVLYQLADSAFPSGSYAHSLGLEALRTVGSLAGEREVALRLGELVWQTAYATLPFLGDAHGGAVAEADGAADRFVTGHVANRASRAQGRALAMAAEAMFGEPLAIDLPHGHAAVALGAVLARAGASLDDARELAMFAALRAAATAAVRLGAIGPLRVQALLHRASPAAARALAATRELGARDAISVAPLIDLVQAAHDRSYARLFQS